MASASEQVRAAIARMKGEKVAAKFSEEDLRKLADQGYVDEDDLRSISRESLIAMGLKMARVDALVGKDSADKAAPAIPIELTLPKELQELVSKVVRDTTGVRFADEISFGGSKLDEVSAEEGLRRIGYEEVRTEYMEPGPEPDIAHFVWNKKEREDDSSNMIRAVEYVKQNLCNKVPGLSAVDVRNRNSFSRSDATPTKRLKLKDTRTDVVCIPPRFETLASQNPRNLLQHIPGIVDLKTEEAWKKDVAEFQDQGKGQFGGCTILTGRRDLGMPTMVTNLVGNSFIYHGYGAPGTAGAHVKELVFSNQREAFEYFAELLKENMAAEAQPITMTAALEALKHRPRIPQELPAPSSPSHQVPAIGRSERPSSPINNETMEDLRQCEYEEVRRDCPGMHLPPFDLFRDYVGALEESLMKASTMPVPSYILCRKVGLASGIMSTRLAATS